MMATNAASAEAPLSGLISDGVDGVYAAGLMARRGDGRLAIATAAGRRGEDQAFGLDDPFRVASVSKMIATTGFMRLVEAGRIHLDDDASAHLGFRLRHPDWPEVPITIRQLLSHTSSLRNGPSYPVPAGDRLAGAFMAGDRHWDGGAWFGPATHTPGSWFSYADVNFCLIAQIVERATGERFDRYMTRNLLGPLGLDAGYNWSGVSQAKRDRVAAGRRWLNGGWTLQVDGIVPPAPSVVYPQPKDGPPVPEAELRLGENGFLFSPQGGLRVSVQDLDRLAAFYREGGAPVVRSETVALMEAAVWRRDLLRPNGDTGEGATETGVFGGYGLGVEVPQSTAPGVNDSYFGEGSPDWRGHLGDAYGWMTGLFWNLKDGATLAWAINGMREEGRRPGRRSALTPAEESVIDLGLAALRSG